MPFGKVPCLFIDGTPLGESGAIIRYLASEFDMNGSNHTQAAYIEMLHGVFSDNYSKLPFSEKDMKLKVGWCKIVIYLITNLITTFVKQILQPLAATRW